MAITNANVPGSPQGYNAAQHVVNQRAVQREDNKAAVDAMVAMGKAMEGAHIGLSRLTKQVQETDKIFEKAARRGDLFSGRAMIDFYRTSEHLNKAFTKTYSTLGSGFSILHQHGLKATETLATHSKELLHFFELSGRQREETNRLAEEAVRINEEMTRQMKAQGGLIDDELRGKQDLLVKQRAVNLAEREFLKFEQQGALVAAAYVATIGQALTLSYEYQKSFKSIALDFKSSLGFIDNLVSVAASARGLASISDAAAAMTELRKAGKSYYEDKDLQKSIIQLSSATDLSAGSATAMARQFQILGGTTEQFKTLGNVFTYFSQQTELTADEVTNLVSAAQPLISDFPRDLQSKTITSILAVGDAFKKAGLNAEELLKTLDEMKDMTSGEGMKSAAMIARFSGVSFAEMSKGVDIGLQAGAVLTARYNFMKQMMSRGMGAATAASIGTKMGLGSAAELKIESRWTPEDLAKRKEQIRLDEEEATAKEHLQDAIDRLLSNPIARLVALIHGIERFALTVGTKAVENIVGFFDTIGKFLDKMGLLSPLTDFVKSLTDFAANPAIGNALTAIATTLLFALPINAAKTFGVLTKGVTGVIFTFAKLGTATSRVIQGLDRQIAANELLAKSSKDAANAAERQASVNELSGLAGGAGIGGGKGGGIAGAAEKVEETAVMEGKSASWISKIATFVKGSKVGRVASGLGGALKSKITGLASGAAGLIKFGGEWGLKFVPILGGIIGTVAGLTTAGSRIGEEGFNVKTAIQGVFDVVGGLLMGFGWVGAAISAVLMGLNSLIDWLFGSKKKEEKGTTVKPTAEAQAAAAGVRGPYQFDTRGGQRTTMTSGGVNPLGGNFGLHGGLSATAAAAGANSNPANIPQGTFGRDQLGSFGYVGDSTPDSNSLMGIGNHGNKLVPGYSVALSAAGAKARGLTSPGQTFTAAGREWRWDDTVPESGVSDPYYIDVYNPLHPPDPGDKSFRIMSREKQEALFAKGPGAGLSGRLPGGNTTNVPTPGGGGNTAVTPTPTTPGGVSTSSAIANVSSDTAAYKNPNQTPFPERLQAVGNEDPAAFIAHHTGGRGTVQSVLDTLHQRHLGVEYIMDRDGNIVKAGEAGSSNILPGWGPKGKGLSNKNIIGMEIIAENDADVTNAQRKSFAEFIAARYPNTPVLGHGEVNPGHKEADEGRSTSAAALALRAKLSSQVSTVRAQQSLPPPSTSISTRLFERHLRDLQRGDLNKVPATQKEMLTEMKASSRHSRDFYTHQMRKDFLGPSLLPDSAEELYRVV